MTWSASPRPPTSRGVCTPSLQPKPSLPLTAGEHQGKPQLSTPAISLSTVYLPPGHLWVCLSIHPSLIPPMCTHLSTHQPIYLSVYPPIYLPICPPVHQPIHLSTHPPIHLSTYPSVHLPTHPSTHLSTGPDICPSVVGEAQLYAAICCFLLPSSEQISRGNILSESQNLLGWKT